MRKFVYDRHKKFFDLCLRLDIPFLTKFIRDKIYDDYFFKEANELKLLSARKVAEIINAHFTFKSVFDIGCGAGIYIEELKKMGKNVCGCDLSVAGIKSSSKDLRIFCTDITKPIILNRKYDLVICFEVGEHINKKYSRQLVKNCVNSGDTVLFTAAPVGQGGVGHINEQPYDFWIALFMEMNFNYNAALSEEVKRQMKKENVVYWIANNFMCFQKC